MKNNWYYFCSLADQLQRTTQFVDHIVDENKKIINGDTFSYEFVKILLLASAEFEAIAKQILGEDSSGDNIVELSRKLLTDFPSIGTIEIITPYMRFMPLCDWEMESDKVKGIDWWADHNHIKHNRYDYFILGTLRNCIYAMGSLMVLEILLDRITANVIDGIDCPYFTNAYAPARLVTETGRDLPDRLSIEVYKYKRMKDS